MPICTGCGQPHAAGARFCQNCGQALGGVAVAPPPVRPAGADWLTLDQVIYTRDRRLGAIGAPLAFVGAFLPWANVPTFWGLSSHGVSSPLAWLVWLAAIAAGILLFRRGMGTPVMIIGICIAALPVLSALGMGGSGGSPGVGLAVAIAGGGLLGVSGWMTREYEGR